MKTTLLLIALLLIPTLTLAQVSVIVTPNPEQLLPNFRQSITLSEQGGNAQVSYWNVGRVSLSDFDNYCFAVYKNGQFLDNITHYNKAIFYNGNYVIKVYKRNTKELIQTVSFTSQVKISDGQYLLIFLGVITLIVLSFLGYSWIQNERLVRQRGWRHP